MNKENAIRLFQDKKIRVLWDEDNEKWFFSVMDVVAVLTDQENFQKARKYWNKLSQRLREESSEVVTKCHRLKLPAEDGKLRKTDCADTETILRIVQSIPSKKAEPFKVWLAKVGNERIDEMYDPELAIDRAMQTYLKKGYSKEWINQRLKTIEIRKELTDEWNRAGVEKQTDYAILTNEITKAWTGMDVKGYKKLKNLKKENLRDNMTNLELVLNMLAEATTTEISKKEDPKTFPESKIVAKRGGTVAGKTRENIEKEIGAPVITSKNAKELHDENLKKKRISNK